VFGEAANRLGVDLVYATDRCHVLDDPWRDAAVAIRFSDEEGSAAAILDSVKSRPVDGVLALGDRPVGIAARVRQALGLPGHPPEAARAARNKRLSRERFRAAGLLTPWFIDLDVADDPATFAARVSYPCVVKPLALSGSRGVMRADDGAGLAAAWRRLRAILHAPDLADERHDARDRALVEEFIEGPEFALEGLMEHGELRVLAIFDKPDPLDGPFFEETIYVTPSRAEPGVQRDIADAVRRAAAALGLEHGPVHAECRVSERGVFVLEVAARPIGGLCARTLRFVPSSVKSSNPQTLKSSDSQVLRSLDSQISFEELLLRQALGERTDGWEREAGAAGVMMIPIPKRGVFRRVAGVEGALGVPGIEDVQITAKADQVLVPLPEGASYLGFIFSRATDSELATAALRTAHTRLDFTIDPEVRVLQSRHG
jgi:hypothetical protein